MRFRFSLMTVIFSLLSAGCAINVYKLIMTGQMTMGRQQVSLSTADTPALLPVMIVLLIIFLFAVFWSAATDS